MNSIEVLVDFTFFQFSFFAMKHADEELEMLLGEIPQVTDNSLRMEGLVAVGVSPVICSRRDEVLFM
jgi:hypothetical protein